MKSSSQITIFSLVIVAPLLIAACSQQPVKPEHSSEPNPVPNHTVAIPGPTELSLPVSTTEPELQNNETDKVDEFESENITLAYQLSEAEEQEQTSRPAQHLVFFGFDKKALNDESMALIQEHGRFLADHPSLKLTVSGHADTQGNPLYNERLALERAQHVAQLLIEAGADPMQLDILSFGASEPVSDATHYRDNRRVELIYQDEYFVRSNESF